MDPRAVWMGALETRRPNLLGLEDFRPQVMHP